MINVNTSRFDTLSLNDALAIYIPDLITDLTTLKTTIDAANDAASVSDLTFTPGTVASDKNTGLQSYKTQLTDISTNISSLISLIDTQIKGNATLLTNLIITVKSDSVASIVFIL